MSVELRVGNPEPLNTLRLDCLEPARDEAAVAQAAVILRGGGLVAFPTETVYGLGALGLDAAAVERIFAAKERPHSDPLILHVAEASQVGALAAGVPSIAVRLMEQFWPGPLTLVLEKSASVPDVVTGGGQSVAVRSPAHPVAQALLRAVRAPLAAPSANLFSRPSPTTAAHVLEDLDGRIDAVLDGGPTAIGVESTVLDVRAEPAILLRPGGVTQEQLEAAGVYVVSRGVVAGRPGEALTSPGLLEKHYSPRARLVLFAREASPAHIHAAAADPRPDAAAVLVFDEDRAESIDAGVRLIRLGSESRPEEAANRLYAAFRQADAVGIRTLYARLAPEMGLGAALNDRLRRAASGRIAGGS